jgi:glycerophosphoryl diester phosphodiesterase
MPISFRAADNGFTHVCAHRGYCLQFPENTLLAFEQAKAAGATTCEIDLVLTRDGEAIVMHDMLLDRTTNGHGFAGDHDLADIRKLDAAAHFPGNFAGVGVSTFGEVLQWAKKAKMGLVVELKERERPDDLTDRVLAVLRKADGFGNVILLSFNHVDLLRVKQKEPNARTEAIIHARHADLIGVMKACKADSVSIELEMFAVEDAKALHEEGYSNRVHAPRPNSLAPYWAGGRDPRIKIGEWLSAGLIDTLSGDDVTFIRKLVEQNPIQTSAAKKRRSAA